jgi:tetratricopeptide (TPR) repeat protein
VVPTLTPNQRLAQVRDTFEAGNHASALDQLEELRKTNPTLAGLDDAEYDIRMGFARTLLDQGNADGAYAQFDGALKIRPGDAAAKKGEDEIILAKNYAIMEANWGKDDEAAIKALDENFARDPNYRETRSKLYSLLIGKADRLLGAGEKDAAVEVLTRAMSVQPDGGEAQRRLTALTPTPTPVPPTPIPAYTAPSNNTAPRTNNPPANNTAPRTTNPPANNTTPANNPPPANNNPPPSSSNNCPGRVCF